MLFEVTQPDATDSRSEHVVCLSAVLGLFHRRFGRWGEVLAAWELCRQDHRDSLPDDIR